MSLFDIFKRSRKTDTAATAKQRLQVLMTLDRSGTSVPDFLPLLQKELIDVIRKYVEIDQQAVKIDVESHEEFSMLEVNVELPHSVVGKAA